MHCQGCSSGRSYLRRLQNLQQRKGEARIAPSYSRPSSPSTVCAKELRRGRLRNLLHQDAPPGPADRVKMSPYAAHPMRCWLADARWQVPPLHEANCVTSLRCSLSYYIGFGIVQVLCRRKRIIRKCKQQQRPASERKCSRSSWTSLGRIYCQEWKQIRCKPRC